MATVDCPTCGAKYPKEKVGDRTRFTCGRCKSPVIVLTVVEPLTDEATLPVVAPMQVVEPIADDAAPTPASARRRAPAKTTRSSVPPAAWILGGVAVIAVVVAAVAMSTKSSTNDAATATAPEPAKADPMKDVDAWKALSDAARAPLVERVLAATDLANDADVKRAADFFAARGDAASAKTLAERVIVRDTGDAWARAALGHVDVAIEVDKCLAQCETADEESDPDFVALKGDRKLHVGAWWQAPDAAATTRALLVKVRESDARLASPYWKGVGHWVRRQRAVDVMRDYPELHATVGPYLIFVSLNAPKNADPKNIPHAEFERAASILERNKKVIAAFYDGWMTEMGPRFGFTRYGPENADFDTLMKMNVFAKADDFFVFNQRVGAGVGGFVRAYYSPLHDRFITTYDGGEGGEDAGYTDQVQCHEATHQLVHFYTWDVTRKAEGREIDWLHCSWRPLWSGEGFAEFFSTHKVVDGKYVWMQPLDERMRQIWIFDEMVKEKGWLPWRLSEFFTMRHGGELSRLAEARFKKAGDEWIAQGVMANLFYARAWSFVHFLWYFEEGGKPKYRDKYVEYLKSEFRVQFVAANDGKRWPNPVDAGDFLRIMNFRGGLAGVEAEWNDYAAKLVAANHRPEWDVERTKMRKTFGFDKADEPKPAKPK